MTEVSGNRFIDRAKSTYSTESIQERMNTPGTGINAAYNNALTEVQETADEVDRSVGDSGSSSSSSDSSSAENTAMWLGLAGTVLSAAPGLITAIGQLTGKIGSGNGGGGGASSTGGATAASGGDPLQTLTNATSAYQSNKSDANLRCLTDAISGASIERANLARDIGAKEANIANLRAMLDSEGNAVYEKCQTTVNGLTQTIEKSNNTIETKTAFVNQTQAQIDNIMANKDQNGQAIIENTAYIKNGEQNVEITRENFDTATANLTDAQKKEAKFQLDQNEYIQQYNEARSAETGLKADLTNAQGLVREKGDAVSAVENRISGLEAQKDSNKDRDIDNSSIKTQIREAKNELRKTKDELREAQRQEREAQNKVDDNKDLQTKLEGKIQVNGQSLAEAKVAVDQANTAISDATTARDKACTDLQGYVDNEAVLQAIGADLETAAKDEQGKYTLTNEQLMQAIDGKTELGESLFSAEKAGATISNKINEAEAALGDEKDVNSLRGKLVKYDQAIQKAEAVRDSSATSLEALTADADLLNKAQDLNYTGGLNGVTKIESAGENKVKLTMYDGSTEVVDVPPKNNTNPTGGANQAGGANPTGGTNPTGGGDRTGGNTPNINDYMNQHNISGSVAETNGGFTVTDSQGNVRTFKIENNEIKEVTQAS